MLLGLLRDSTMSALVPVSLEGLRQEIEKGVVFMAKVSTSVEIPFSAAMKRVLQFAAEEANALRHRHIGTEHMLLGLLREEHSAAAAALAAHGVRLSDVRQKVEKLPGPLDASPQAGIQMAIDGIKSLVEDLGRTPRGSPEARELVTRVHAILDALLNDSGLR